MLLFFQKRHTFFAFSCISQNNFVILRPVSSCVRLCMRTRKGTMKVAIVKYNAGNIFSVINAVKRLGIEPLWTDNAEELLSADRVIFPGQGEASHAMAYLRERGLDNVIRDMKQPHRCFPNGSETFSAKKARGQDTADGMEQPLRP